MASNTLYIPFFDLETVFLDKTTGLPLSGGTVTFYQDTQRATLKPIFQLTGNAPDYSFIQLSNPMTLSISGTFVDDNGFPVVPYGYPFDTEGAEERYYVKVESSEGVLQLEREDVPFVIESAIPPEERTNTENELSNPQFVEVLFDSINGENYAVTGNATTTVAPDWEIISNGTGSITLNRIDLTALTTPTNPPFALEINADSTLGTDVTLRQTLPQSPRLIAGGYASVTFIASVTGPSAITLVANYVRSGGSPTTIQVLSSSVTSNGLFQVIAGNVLIGPTQNSDPGSTGSVSIDIVIPTARAVQISSIQFVGVSAPINIPFDEISTPRQIDYLFHYYKPLLEYKPIPSILVGWDFPLNPAQFGDTQTITTTAAYAWDQLIMQTVVGNVNLTRFVPTNGLSLEMVSANEVTSLTQYLLGPGGTLKKTLSGPLSVNIQANTIGSDTVSVKVYLFVAPLTSVIPTLPATIGTLNADGTFSVTASGWTEVTRGGFDTASATLSETGYANIGFSGWQSDTTQQDDTNIFAIVVVFAGVEAGATISINSISLTPGTIPTIPAPQSPITVLNECKEYYEKSYDISVLPGTVTTGNQLIFSIDPLNIKADGSGSVEITSMMPTVFQVDYGRKKQLPTVTLYSPNSGASGTVYFAPYRASGVYVAAGVSVPVNWTHYTVSIVSFRS